LLAAAELGSQSCGGNLVELGMTVTVRGDLNASGRQLRELFPREHTAGCRPGCVLSRIEQPSRRDEHCRRESVLEQYRQRFFDEVGVAVIECEHDRARRKRLSGPAALAKFAERQSGEPLPP